MTSSDFSPEPYRRRRRRPHRVLRAFKLVLPFLLLLAVGLLSAGVIRLVEVTAAPPSPAATYSETIHSETTQEGASADPSRGLRAGRIFGIPGTVTGEEELRLAEPQSLQLEEIPPTSFLPEMPQERAADSIDAERAPGTLGANLNER